MGSCGMHHRRSIDTLADVGMARCQRQYPHGAARGSCSRALGAALLAEGSQSCSWPTTTALVAQGVRGDGEHDELRRERQHRRALRRHNLKRGDRACCRGFGRRTGCRPPARSTRTLRRCLAARPRLDGPVRQRAAIPRTSTVGDSEVGEECVRRSLSVCGTGIHATDQVLREVEAGLVRCRRAEDVHADLRAISMSGRVGWLRLCCWRPNGCARCSV